MTRQCVAAFCALLAAASQALPVSAACTATPVQDANPTNGSRTGIAEPFADQLWVSGTISVGATQTYPYVERFDRRDGWSRTVLSRLQRSAFNGIAAVSPERAIAVGFEGGGATALAVTFDGFRWVQTLGGTGQLQVRGSLQRIVAVPKTSAAFAVLAYGASNLLYWNGGAWSPVMDALPTGAVLAIDASSPSDVWAVGGMTNPFGVVHGMLERFDGHVWTRLAAPARSTLLTGVSVRGADDAWVTGLTQSGSSFVPYAAHWNGSTWQPLNVPLEKGAAAVYGDVYAESATSMWIGVSAWDGTGVLTSLWHWNGHMLRFVSGSVGWSATPVLGGFPDDVWFAAGPFKRSPVDGNEWMGQATCDLRAALT